MRELVEHEGFWWILAIAIVFTAMTIMTCVCQTAYTERDKLALSRGYVQHIEQAQRVWVKP